MIKVCIFDMGGVLVRDHDVAPALIEYLGREERSFRSLGDTVLNSLREHGKGNITETEFWEIYRSEIHEDLFIGGESLLGRFFTPKLDIPTASVIGELKATGMRVVCGTNVIASHYRIHQEGHQYELFDAVYPSHLMHIIKPDPTFFQWILDQEGISANEAFFTDDMAVNTQSSSALGIHSFVYTDAETLRTQLSDLDLL